MDYEFMASNYIHSTDGLNASKPIPSLAIGFKDPLVRTGAWPTSRDFVVYPFRHS